MLAPYIKLFATSFIVIGGAWAMYCMTPAGAAEREHTRRQKQMDQQFLHAPTKSASKA